MNFEKDPQTEAGLQKAGSPEDILRSLGRRYACWCSRLRNAEPNLGWIWRCSRTLRSFHRSSSRRGGWRTLRRWRPRRSFSLSLTDKRLEETPSGAVTADAEAKKFLEDLLKEPTLKSPFATTQRAARKWGHRWRHWCHRCSRPRNRNHRNQRGGCSDLSRYRGSICRPGCYGRSRHWGGHRGLGWLEQVKRHRNHRLSTPAPHYPIPVIFLSPVLAQVLRVRNAAPSSQAPMPAFSYCVRGWLKSARGYDYEIYDLLEAD